jgi:hypothetical protein
MPGITSITLAVPCKIELREQNITYQGCWKLLNEPSGQGSVTRPPLRWRPVGEESWFRAGILRREGIKGTLVARVCVFV